MPDTTTTQERRITLRTPSILAARIDAAVRVRQAEERKFSMNDWIVEACRAYLDGGVTTPKADILGQMQRRAGGHAAGLPVEQPVRDTVYEYDEGGPVEDVPGPGITKPTAAAPSKPVATLGELIASGLVKVGIPEPSKPPSEPEPAGTAAPAADHPEVDGW